MRKVTSNSKPVRSIIRATDILISLGDGLCKVTDIANRCKLSNSSVHRLLKTLEVSGLVTEDPVNHHYYLGHLIAKFVSNPRITHHNLIMLAIEEMKHLWDISEETVGLDIQIGTQRIHLQEIPSKHDLRVTEEGRLRSSGCAGAQEKVLLSQFGDNELRLILKHIDLVPLTDKTITDKEILMEELKGVREQGYAISYGERVIGALGIAVPIGNYFCPNALSILGPEQRLKPKVKELIEELKVSVSRISQTLSKII